MSANRESYMVTIEVIPGHYKVSLQHPDEVPWEFVENNLSDVMKKVENVIYNRFIKQGMV